MAKLTTIAATLALAILIGCASNANKKIKEMYWSYGEDHIRLNCDDEHKFYVDLNLHVKTENYKDGDTVEVQIEGDNGRPLFAFDTVTTLSLKGIVFNNEMVFEKVLAEYTLNLSTDIDTDEPNCNANTTSLPENNNDTWFSYYNKDSTLIGFKDKNGVIKTEPKFESFLWSIKFDDIIALEEKIDGIGYSYYFTKSGKTFGRDSVYFTDLEYIALPDCESEGFIRFTHYKYFGMFNKNGDVVIPAKYNSLTSVTNGMMRALEGTTGGKNMLIDTLGNILVDNFSSDEKRNLSLFSIQKTATPSPDTIRESFPAKDGGYYSFINYEKEFKQWLKYDLLVNLTSKKLLNSSFDTIWSRPVRKNLRGINAKLFINSNFEILKNGLLSALNSNEKYSITKDDNLDELSAIYGFTRKGTEIEKYLDNCGHLKERYPVLKIKSSDHNNYYFLRTDSGYRLIYVDITASLARQTGTFTDSRDNKTYKTVKIGEQVWMAENLNYEAEGSVCYDNDPANCVKYGKLYNWHTAMKVCPKGWHLPSNAEWAILGDFAGGREIAGKKLKATSGWDYEGKSGNGTDAFGFSALPGGEGWPSGKFYYIGNNGEWWSTNDDNFDYRTANSWEMFGNDHWNCCDMCCDVIGNEVDYDHLSYDDINESLLLSVRCLQD